MHLLLHIIYCRNTVVFRLLPDYTLAALPDTEDRATLGSDPSAVPGLREAVQKSAAFFHCLLETKALNPGGLGAEPPGFNACEAGHLL